VTGKPTTFPPVIGTTATTAAAGNHVHANMVTHAGNLVANHLVAGSAAAAVKDVPGITVIANNNLQLAGLAGTGNRMVTVNAAGQFTTGAMPSVGSFLPLAGGTLTGSLGIGVAPTQALHVSGQIVATDDITAFFSDMRLKEGVIPLTGALDKLSQLEAFTYVPNQKAVDLGAVSEEARGKRRVGVSAQSVQQVLPEAVSPAPFDQAVGNKSKSGEDYLTVDYAKLVPLLIEAVKELQQQVEELKNA
jgi:hypothetical protein